MFTMYSIRALRPLIEVAFFGTLLAPFRQFRPRTFPHLSSPAASAPLQPIGMPAGALTRKFRHPEVASSIESSGLLGRAAAGLPANLCQVPPAIAPITVHVSTPNSLPPPAPSSTPSPEGAMIRQANIPSPFETTLGALGGAIEGWDEGLVAIKSPVDEPIGRFT